MAAKVYTTRGCGKINLMFWGEKTKYLLTVAKWYSMLHIDGRKQQRSKMEYSRIEDDKKNNLRKYFDYLISLENYMTLPISKAGVYALFHRTSKTGAPCCLYVGATKNVKTRVGRFMHIENHCNETVNTYLKAILTSLNNKKEYFVGVKLFEDLSVLAEKELEYMRLFGSMTNRQTKDYQFEYKTESA